MQIQIIKEKYGHSPQKGILEIEIESVELSKFDISIFETNREKFQVNGNSKLWYDVNQNHCKGLKTISFYLNEGVDENKSFRHIASYLLGFDDNSTNKDCIEFNIEMLRFLDNNAAQLKTQDSPIADIMVPSSYPFIYRYVTSWGLKHTLDELAKEIREFVMNAFLTKIKSDS